MARPKTVGMNPQTVAASEILKHVAATGRPYPVQFDFEVSDDVGRPDGCHFDAGGFVCMSKADWSRYAGVAESQTSRWVKAGLPLTEDGKIVLVRADSWLKTWRPDWCANRDFAVQQKVEKFLATL